MTRWIMRLTGHLPIGWLQLLHNRTRLVAAVGGVTFANVLIFMQLGFMNALFETSVLTHRSLNADIVLISSDFKSLREANPIPRARLYQALSVAGVNRATPLYLGTKFWTDPGTRDTTNFRVIGFSPDERVFTDEDIANKSHGLREPDTAIVDRRTREYSQEIEQVLLQGNRFEVEISGRKIDLIDQFDQGASFDVDGSLLVSDQTFLRMFANRRSGTPTMILIQVEDHTDAVVVAAQINERLPEGDTLAMTKEQFVAAEQEYQATQTPIGFVFGFGVVIGFIVGLVIVYQVLATDVQDHMSEYATFKAIGYAPRFFLGIVFEEAVSLAALGFGPGLLISLSLYRLAAAKTALPITMPWTRPLLVFVLTTLMCTISGAIATKRLNSADPAELF